MAGIKKADREQLLYIIAEEFGGEKEGWEQLAVEMVRAMSDTEAKEILGYIARMWDIDTMGYEASAKKSKMKKSSSVESMMDELLELAYDYDSQWVDTIMNAQYEYSYGSYQDVKADINEVLQKSDVGKIIGLCEDILQEMDALGKTKKSVSKPKDNTMSFEDNVNKMRTHNYARTGNINTVMKKRE